MVELHWVEQGSEAWLEARRNMYTGSNAYKLLSSMDVSEYARAVQSEFKGNYWTKRGHILEDEAIELYEAIRKVKVERPGYVTNSKYSHCLYSPDGWPPVPLLEVKCFDVPNHLQLINAKTEDDLPLKIRAQLHYGLLITEKPYAELIPYNPSPELTVQQQFKIIIIKRNRNILNNLKNRILLANEMRTLRTAN